jgi:hypothetical protein
VAWTRRSVWAESRDPRCASISARRSGSTPVPVPESWRVIVAPSLVEARKSAGARDAYNARVRECRDALEQSESRVTGRETTTTLLSNVSAAEALAKAPAPARRSAVPPVSARRDGRCARGCRRQRAARPGPRGLRRAPARVTCESPGRLRGELEGAERAGGDFGGRLEPRAPG